MFKSLNKFGGIYERYFEKDGEILGYAYAGVFKDRAAYDWSAEITIYLKHDAVKCGFGRILYEALEKEMKKRGFLNLYACIGYPIDEDRYLTKNSAQFHAHLGYKTVGEFHKCGYKFGRWLGITWLDKELKSVELPSNFPVPWRAIMQDGQKNSDILGILSLS